VDVVIVSFNSGSDLQRCIASVLSNVAVGQVIVVDNASSDGSIEALSASERLVILRQNVNLGFARAANIGWQTAKAAQILFLNPDCLMSPQDIRSLLITLQNTANAGALSCVLENTDGSVQASSLRFDATPVRAVSQALGLHRFGINRKLPDIAGVIEVDACSGALMLMPRTVLEICKGWDEGYFLHCEDLDLCRRLRALGFKVWVDTRMRVRHDKGTSSRSVPRLVADAKYRGMMRYFHKFDAVQTAFPLRWILRFGAWLRWRFSR
jgi:N-acetylglucosaminyl-diphospho-decaprenol L-rhamnosyltransferase